MTNLFMGDDAYHGGAFMLDANFGFYAFFKPQDNPQLPPKTFVPFDYGTNDGYDFYLKVGPIGNLSKLLQGRSALFDDQMRHDTFDDYWKARDLAPHLKNVHCAVLTVGGWFDAEDLQGPFTTFHSIGKNNPETFNAVVVGPWVHGGWAPTTANISAGQSSFRTPATSIARTFCSVLRALPEGSRRREVLFQQPPVL